MKQWLFWDWFHVEHQDNATIRQGDPVWVPEATYEDPVFDYLGFWPRVFRDDQSGHWKMLYLGSGFPMTLLGAESEDGIAWKPMDRPDVDPGGEKLAPHHLLSVPNANGGMVHLDPDAEPDRRFRLFCSQRGGSRRHGKLDTSRPFHEIVTGDGLEPYHGHNRVLSSPDGVQWRMEPEVFFDKPGWFPEPPFSGFRNTKSGLFTLVSRHGWGDRRVVGLDSPDGLAWDGEPYHIMQPDVLDAPQTQFYGMPVTPYGEMFVGFLWTAHFASAERLDRWNQLSGSIDSQLTYSYDGRAFQRFFREPFVTLNPPGQPASSVIYPVSLVDRGDQLYIYSSGTPNLHMQHTSGQFVRKGEGPSAAIVLHTIRRDGFAYLASQGSWAEVSSKPMILLEPRLAINALAPHGEIAYQLSDVTSSPLQGYAYSDCVPFEGDDDTSYALRWRGRRLEEIGQRPVRLELRFRNARIHAVSGEFHFADALDILLLEHGQEIHTSRLDF
jgi:hypothetical protein